MPDRNPNPRNVRRPPFVPLAGNIAGTGGGGGTVTLPNPLPVTLPDSYRAEFFFKNLCRPSDGSKVYGERKYDEETGVWGAWAWYSDPAMSVAYTGDPSLLVECEDNPQDKDPEKVAYAIIDGLSKCLKDLVPAGSIIRGYVIVVNEETVSMTDSAGNTSPLRCATHGSDISDGIDCLDENICFDATSGKAQVWVKYTL